MEMLIVCLVVMGFIFGFMGLLIVPGQNKTVSKVFTIILLVIAWILASVGIWAANEGKKDRWNDGFCECGTHWELRGGSENRHHRRKYNVCPNCYAEITM